MSKILEQRGDRVIITQWFIRSLGVVSFFNFFSLLLQVKRCMGQDGLLPVAEYVKGLYDNPAFGFLDRIVACPSVFLWLPQDVFLIAGAIIGVLLALCVIVGVQTRWCFLCLFPLYLSYVSVGQELYSFQWDSLILETTFLAILLPSSGMFFRKFSVGADKLVIWLLLWLLFRLYVESGVAKLFWGPESWSGLEAMGRYYQTAPIPTILGWYAHFLPEGWHKFETGATLFIEILLPALFFSGKWPKRIAFVVFTGFQIGIILTANYGIFCYTTICLHLFLLTDRDILTVGRYLPIIKKRIPDVLPKFHVIKPKIWIYPIAVIIIIFSSIEFVMFAGGRGVYDTTLAKIQKYTGATRICSRYHLFGPIDPIRYELVFECKYEGTGWTELEFPYKVDNLYIAPPFIAPLHPRVDFRLWFERYPVRFERGSIPYPDVAIAPSVLTKYIGKLAIQLLDNPKLAYRHFVRSTRDEYSDQKPQEVRITYYHYSITDTVEANTIVQDTLKSVKQYWSRIKVGTVYIDTSLEYNKELKIKLLN